MRKNQIRGSEFITKTWIKIWTVLNEEIQVEVDNNVRPDNNNPTQLKAKQSKDIRQRSAVATLSFTPLGDLQATDRPNLL